MNIGQAIHALNEGKAVRRQTWEKERHLKKIDDEIKSYILSHYPFIFNYNILNSKEWVIVGDEENIIDFAAASTALMDGKKVRFKVWTDGSYLSFDKQSREVIISKIIEHDIMLTFNDIMANDWEIYE